MSPAKQLAIGLQKAGTDCSAKTQVATVAMTMMPPRKVVLDGITTEQN
jgi:hypothetical protein